MSLKFSENGVLGGLWTVFNFREVNLLQESFSLQLSMQVESSCFRIKII